VASKSRSPHGRSHTRNYVWRAFSGRGAFFGAPGNRTTLEDQFLTTPHPHEGLVEASTLVRALSGRSGSAGYGESSPPRNTQWPAGSTISRGVACTARRTQEPNGYIFCCGTRCSLCQLRFCRIRNAHRGSDPDSDSRSGSRCQQRSRRGEHHNGYLRRGPGTCGYQASVWRSRPWMG